MQLVYGGYFHVPNSVHVTGWTRKTILGATGWPERLRIEASFKAKILGINTFYCMSQAYVMQAAYSVGGQSLGFFDNVGNTTVWILDSSSALGGVMVTNPVSYGEVKGAEGSTYLWATFGLTAEYLVSNPNTYMEFRESISYADNGGQPLTVEKLPVNAAPLIQAVTQSSFYYATQSGELWAASPNPQPMAPLFPQFLRGQPNSRKVTPVNPKTIRGIPYRWGTSWSYDYISTSPFTGLPNVF